MKVFVYFNLHKKKWSVKALEGPNKGRVIAHRYNVLLRDCTFKVSQAGRKRVLKEKRKNVHAGIVGFWDNDWSFLSYQTQFEVTYNPYKYETFVNKKTEQPVYQAEMVFMNCLNKVQVEVI